MPNEFDIDYKQLVHQDLPVDCRTEEDEAWLDVLVQPVEDVYDAFMANREKNLYDLAHNSQIPYMEAALNDAFDETGRGIYISDPAYVDALYLYLDDELKSPWLGLESEVGSTAYDDPQWLYLESELYDGSGVQFIVNVPMGVVTAVGVGRIRAVVDHYRLPSKTNYSIVTF